MYSKRPKSSTPTQPGTNALVSSSANHVEDSWVHLPRLGIIFDFGISPMVRRQLKTSWSGIPGLRFVVRCTGTPAPTIPVRERIRHLMTTIGRGKFCGSMPLSWPTRGAVGHLHFESGMPLLIPALAKRLLPKATSFAFVPRSAAPTSAPHVIAVSDAGAIQLAVIRDAPKHQWSSRGDLTASVGRGFKLYHTHGAIDGVSREPWDLHHDNNSPPSSPQLDQDREELMTNGTSLKRDSNPVGWLSFQKQSAWKGEGLSVQQSHLPLPSTLFTPGRKYSPASTMRIPLERKGLPSPSMTPKPGLLSLSTEEQTNNDSGNTPVKAPQPPPTTSAILKTATMTETPRDVSLSVSRQRSSHRGRSERRTAEAFLSQDISVVMRRRVLQGYGLESVRTPTICHFPAQSGTGPTQFRGPSRGVAIDN